MKVPDTFTYRGEHFSFSSGGASEADYFRGQYISRSAGTLGKSRVVIALMEGGEILVLPGDMDDDEGYTLPPPFPTVGAALAHVAMMDSIAA